MTSWSGLSWWDEADIIQEKVTAILVSESVLCEVVPAVPKSPKLGVPRHQDLIILLRSVVNAMLQ